MISHMGKRDDGGVVRNPEKNPSQPCEQVTEIPRQDMNLVPLTPVVTAIKG